MSISKHLTYNFFLSLSQVLFPLITIPYISRVLDPQSIGLVGFVDSYTLFFIGIAEFGIITYGIREISKAENDPAKINKLVSELLLLQILFTACTFICYAISTYYLWDKINDIRLYTLSAILLLTNAFYSEWYFWGKKRFKYIAIRSILIRILGAISIFYFVKDTNDAYIYYSITSASYLLIIISNLFVLFTSVKIRFNEINLRQHIKNLILLNGINVAYSILLMLDTPILRIMSNEAEAGYYFFSIKIVRLSSTLISDIFLVLFPTTITFIEKGNNDRLNYNLRQSISLIFLLSIPMTIGVFWVAEDITSLYFGSAFFPISDNLKILSLFPVIYSFELFLNRQILLTHNKDRLVFWIYLTGCIFFIFSSGFFSFHFGARGASIALMLSELIILLSAFFYTFRLYKSYIIPEKKTLIQIIAGCLLIIMFIKGVKYLEINSIIELIIIITGSIIVYFAWMIWVVKNTIAQKMYQFVFNEIKLKK